MNHHDYVQAPHPWPITDDAIRAVFESMLADGSWGRYHGPHCDALRSALSDYHSVDHAIVCSSGTSAIELALRSVPVGPGDEVILAAYDFKANFVNVLTLGAIPVLIDTLPDAPVMDPGQLALACSDRTRAIIVSHLHGSMAPMDEICEFARSRKIAVIEDACQCPGAVLNGRRAGTTGDIGVLSFGGSKLLTSGRGGALVTSVTAMAQRIKLFTHRGNEAYPLSEMQAALLLPQLKQLDCRNKFRYERAMQFVAAFQDSAVLQPVIWPEPSCSGSTQPAFYKLAFLMNKRISGRQREQLCLAARDAAIPLNSAFHALHLIHSQRRFRSTGDLPNASRLHHHLTVLHHTALLQTEAETTAMAARLFEICDSV